MPTSGSVRPSSNGIYINWYLAAQDVATNRSWINVTFGWGFHSSPLDRQLDNGILQLNGVTQYQNTGRVKNYTGDFTDRDYAAWSGQLVIAHDNAGNATFSLFGAMTGYSGYRSQGSNSWSLPTIPRFPSAPGAPTVSGNLDSDPTTVGFIWTAPSDVGAGLSQREVQVANNPSFTSPLVDSTATWGTNYNATGIPKGATLYVRVRASSAAGWGPWSGATTFPTGTTVPSAPGTPTASGITGTSMTVQWSAPSDNGGASLTSYEVQRADNNLFTTNMVSTNLPASGSSLQVTGLAHTKTYYFRVRATNSTGTSAWSTTASATTTTTVPDAPAAPTITGRTPTSMTVAWSAPADNGGSAITGYDVQWSEHPNFDPASSASSASPYTIANLTVSTAYYVRVRAKSAVGVGAWSQATPTRTTSGVHVPNTGHTAWLEADVWVAVQGAAGLEWRRCNVITIAG